MTSATLLSSGRPFVVESAVRSAHRIDSQVAVRPLSVSIVTPSLNGGSFFRQTFESVMSQADGLNLEWIIVDGGSRDDTLPMLRSIDDPRIKWISETDGGQAAAINKGLAMASGDIVAWLNCDDLYRPGVLADVVDTFIQNPVAQWIVGRCNIINSAGKLVRNGVTIYKDRLLHSYSLRSLLRINMISQPAVFWRREFQQSIGPLDESLYYTMDYDLWLRMARRRPPLILPQVLASFRVHCDSKSRGGRRPQFDEGYRVACRYFDCDRISRVVHRVNVEKIVWGYRAMRLIDDCLGAWA